MSSAKSWFVQTGFGSTLGPMPADALLEMVRTGALVPMDQVRASDNDEWILVSEMPDLMGAFASEPASTEQSTSEQSTSDKVVEPAPAVRPKSLLTSSRISLVPPIQPVSFNAPAVSVEAPVTKVATPSEIVVEPRSVPCEVAPVVVPPLDDDSASTAAPPENDLIANWKSQRIQSKAEMGLVSLAAEMTHAEDQEDFAPELPPDLLEDHEKSDAIAAASTKPASRPAARRPAFLDQIAGLESGPRSRIETPQQKWDRWRRSLPTWPIMVAVALVLLGTWSYWPRSHRGYYQRYLAIWDEWKTRRTDFKDKDGWDHFLKHTAAELDDTVPWLEQNARATDREQLLLLWIGRDCFRKMLKQPRQIGSAEEKQLQILLTKLRELHESPSSTTLNGGSAANKGADPEQPGAGAFDPNSVRAEPKPAVPADPALPAKPNESPSVAPE